MDEPRIYSRLSQILPGSVSYNYDSNDRLTTDTYDNDGNTLSSAGTASTYDFENRMLTHGSVSMVYDGDGNRVSETTGGVTTKYLIDSLNPTGYAQVLDELVSGAVTKTYTYGLQGISENQLVGSTWTPSFYGYDGHGNVRFLTSTTGVLGNTYQFDAFGMPIASAGTTANTYLYSGERFDQNIGLYHLRARYYNQGTGRFETMDPGRNRACCALHLQQEDIFDPRTLHKYVYAANNPVNASDPTGRDIGEEGYADSLIAQVRPIIHEAAKSEIYEFCRGVAVIWTAENPNFTPDELTLYYAACVATLGGDW